MTIKNIVKKVLGVLPVSGFITYEINRVNKLPKDRDEGFKYIFKSGFHVFYLAVFGFWFLNGSATGNWTPNQYLQHREKLKIEEVQKEQYKQKLFGKDGYAQKDDDLMISFEEKLEFYKKERLENKIIFSDLTLKELEKAVKSYEFDSQ